MRTMTERVEVAIAMASGEDLVRLCAEVYDGVSGHSGKEAKRDAESSRSDPRLPGSSELMRLAYFDCFSGLSGDMALAALIHAGADVGSVRSILQTFPVDDFEIEVEEVELRGIASLRVQVLSGPQSVIRTYSSIRPLLEEADLPTSARRIAQRAYQRLAESSAIVHGKDPDLVTFHEFGAMDCLVD